MMFAFDLETTGLDVTKDEPVEIAFALLEPEGIYNITSFIIKTEIPVSTGAFAAHKIGSDIIEKGIPPYTVATFLRMILENVDAFVGYNIFKFDVPMLMSFLKRHCQDVSKIELHKCEDPALWWCADKTFNCPRPINYAGNLELSQRKLPYGSKYHLATVCEQLGVPLINAHRAANDLEATIQVWRKMRQPKETI